MKFISFYLLPVFCHLVMACTAFVIYRRLQKFGALIISAGFLLAPLSIISYTAIAQRIQSAGAVSGPESMEFMAMRIMMYSAVLSLIVATVGFLVLAFQVKKVDTDAT